MPKTYEPIATTTLSTDTATITFSSIPATYTDLVFVVNSKFDNAATLTDPFLRVNGSSTTYSATWLRGNGTTAASGRLSNTDAMYYVGGYSTSFGTLLIHFQNYANTNVYKTVLMRANAADASTLASVFLWRNTNAINEISITASDVGAGTPDKFSSGSTFTLYGIKASA